MSIFESEEQKQKLLAEAAPEVFELVTELQQNNSSLKEQLQKEAQKAKTKQQLTSVKAKAAFVEKYGLQEWKNLPAR